MNTTKITQLMNQLQQMENGSTELQSLIQSVGQLTTSPERGSSEEARQAIAQLEQSIQKTVEKLDNQQGMQRLQDTLNQIQVELMELSQDIEHQQLNQTKTNNIPGEPLEMDKDPQPGHPLA